MADSQGPGEIASLTTLRGVAALWVALFHLFAIFDSLLPEAAFLRPLVGCGHLAVPLFFVLSGYVLALRYAEPFRAVRRRELGRFWWLRFGRVYPVHLFTLLLCVGMVSRRGWPTDGGHTLGYYVANLALVHAWGFDFQLSWNFPSWSISSEWFAYLLFPFLACAVVRCRAWVAAVLLVAACAASAWVFSYEKFPYFAGLVMVLPTFAGGVLLGVLCPPSPAGAAARGWPEAFVALVVALPYVVADVAVRNPMFLALFFALVALLGTCGHAALAPWKWRPLVFLGEVSYSLYMTHAITITLLVRFVLSPDWNERPLPFRAGVVVGCLVAVALGTLATYFAVERPCREWSRRVGRRPAL